MKYLRKFATEAEVEMDALPCVSLIDDIGQVIYSAKPNNGVYIQHKNGGFYTNEEWLAKDYANEDANGVALISDVCSFVIAKENLAKGLWLSSALIVDGVTLTDNSTTAKKDYKGKESTELIKTDTASAAYACDSYIFPNGKKGYLPALGEWAVAAKNKAAIVSAMAAIGGTEMAGGYWSSTQFAKDRAYFWDWDGNDYGVTYKTWDKGIRPFAPLNI